MVDPKCAFCGHFIFKRADGSWSHRFDGGAGGWPDVMRCNGTEYPNKTWADPVGVV